MKRNIYSLILLPLIYFIISGCYKNTSGKETNYINASDIEGVWTMQVKNGNFKGNEEIYLLSSNNLIIRDSLIFSGEDSGFSFILPINVNLEGSWKIEKDSMFINYKSESIDIQLNEKEFIIYDNQENADQKAFEALKNEMGNKLFGYVASYLAESYQGVSDKELFFGNILHQKADTLWFRLNNNQFCLTRLNNSYIGENN